MMAYRRIAAPFALCAALQIVFATHAFAEEAGPADGAAPASDAEHSSEAAAEPSSWKAWVPRILAQGAFSYGYDFNDPVRNATNAQEGLYSGMDKADAFNVDLLQIQATGKLPYVGYRVKVDTGDLARVVSDAGTANRNIIFYKGGGQWEVALQEAFLYTELGPVTLTAGRVPSPIGYEVVEPWANAHITYSRAWYEQPISFDGVTLSGSAYNIDGLVGYVNSYFRNDEYDRFAAQLGPNSAASPTVQTDWSAVRHSDSESGFIYKLGTRVFDTDISAAGFYGKKDQASISLRRNNPLDNSLSVAVKPAAQVLFNFVVSRAFPYVNVAGEFNYGHIDGVASKVFLDFDNPDQTAIDSGDRCSTGSSTCAGQTINGTLYLGVPFLQHGSFNVRTDYGSYDTPTRFKETRQWSFTSTVMWQFTDLIGLRLEYRYDGSDNKSNLIILDNFEKDDHDTASAHTIHLQLVAGFSSDQIWK